MKAFTFILLIILSTAVLAQEDFSRAEELIQAKTPCDQLSDADLALIGDYYMEQMHPGDAHEQMDQMMGGEGSESLELMHINMAKSMYCGENDNGMMGYGMMRGGNMAYGMTGYGMMGGNLWMGLYGLVYLAVAAFIVGIIFWWTKSLVERGERHGKRSR